MRLLIGAIGFALLFWQKTGVGFLGMHFVPASVEIMRTGLGAALLGLALAAWARVHLGQHWSDKVVIQPDHDLVRTGPYARVRHPIYSGVLLGIAGTAVVVAEWRGVVAFVVMLLNYTVKARSEDKILDECFREEFREYQQAAGLLFPRLRQHGTGK
jgi:protein-S-isoprenylcysteine O-methyltransferase Ste14